MCSIGPQAVFGGGGGGSADKDQIDTAIDALVKGSRSFQAHHRRPVVLVLDDVDKCAAPAPRCKTMCHLTTRAACPCV